MRFEEALARMVPLPVPLPPAPPILMPVRADTGERRPLGAGEGFTASRPAAVLVLVVPDVDGQSRVVLTERLAYEGFHSAEVSFPGGKAEPGDVDAVATALREAAEEVGLDPEVDGIEILGRLDEVWIPVSGFRITPVLGIARRPPRLRAHPDEVARIVEAPLACFLPSAEIRVVERRIGPWDLRYGIYSVDDLEIWGATARILGQLGAVVGEGG